MASNLTQRVLFAVVAIPLAIGLVWLGGWPLAFLVAAISVLGVRELFDIAARRGSMALRPSGEILAAVVPLATYGALSDPMVATWLATWWPHLGALVVVAWLVGLLLARRADQSPLPAISITVFAVIYASALPSFLLAIRHGSHGTQSWAGTALVFFPLVVVWVCDSAAMFGGKAIGGPKLAPSISPGKTRSGGIAGLVGGVIVAPLFALLVFPAVEIALALGPAITMALTWSVIGQLGDLAESLFKREAGVKDSSNLIPGHGGVLDRFDALYLVTPVAAICYALAGLA
jgi:phosphatidate cytidylyltransferase